MKIALLVGATVVLQGVQGVALFPRGQVPGVVSAPVWRRDETRNVAADLVRRDHLERRATSSTVSLDLINANNKLLYFANSSPLL